MSRHSILGIGLAVGLALGLTVCSQGAMAQSCAQPGNLAAQATEVVAIVNAERAKSGLGPLAIDPLASLAAQNHACDMAAKGYFSHKATDGSTPKRRLSRAGCRTKLSAENIAWGQRSAASVMETWMNSKGHRTNILRNRVTVIGIGIAPDASGRPYWVQVFARGC